MGTNYFGRVIPSKERKKELHDAIEVNDFTLISKLKSEMYDPIQLDDDGNIVGGEVHLGKGSGGWKFLWNPNVFVIRHGHTEWEEFPGGRSSHWIPEPSTLKYLYPLTKRGLKAFIDREDVLIYDEYNEPQGKEEFWKMTLEWGNNWPNSGWDSDSYYRDHPMEHTWLTGSELIDLLKSEGYKLSRYNTDFYSDGLWFSTSTEFS